MKAYSVELQHHKWYQHWFIPQAVDEQDAIRQATEASNAANDGAIYGSQAKEITCPFAYGEQDGGGDTLLTP